MCAAGGAQHANSYRISERAGVVARIGSLALPFASVTEGWTPDPYGIANIMLDCPSGVLTVDHSVIQY